MIAFSINTELLGELIIEQIASSKPIFESALKIASDNQIKRTKDRVQKEGKNESGGIMKTKSRNKEGAYSSIHAEARLNLGLQITKMDLTFTGEMMSDFKAQKDTYKKVDVVFATNESFEKSKKNEKYQGAIFGANAEDVQKIKDDFHKNFTLK